MERAEISQYTTMDFVSWRESNSLILTPKFQRREVWKTPARSFFIDSLLKDIPVPPIFIRSALSEDRRRTTREIIDGQQRLRSVLDFVDNKFALSKSLDNPSAGKRFKDLSREEQAKIRNYSFLCEVFKYLDDAEVLDVFARTNMNSVGLNRQELRNGLYFGQFKQSSYSLAHTHLEFWRKYRIFSEAKIARMNEVEFTSELVVAQLAGQQDKKQSLDKYYADNDEVYPKRRLIEKRFRDTIDNIVGSLDEVLLESEFRRPALFYSLFCCVYHRLFGMPLESNSSPKKGKLRKEEMDGLREAVLQLSEKVIASNSGEILSVADHKFIVACQRQTDNISPRKTRFSTLYKLAFK